MNFEKIKLSNREKQARRNAELQRKAEELGWPSWITMLTAIKNGEATVVRINKTTAQPGN